LLSSGVIHAGRRPLLPRRGKGGEIGRGKSILKGGALAGREMPEYE